MYPILFSIMGISFYSYGLFAAISLIGGYIVIDRLFLRTKLDRKYLLERSLLVFIAGVTLSRLSYFLIYHQEFQHWYEVFYLWQGGLISFSGIIGGIIAYAYIFRKNLWLSLDILALAGLLGIFFWRIGCTLTGDHPTIESSTIFAIGGHVPVALFESIAGLMGFFVLGFIYSHKIFKHGLLFWIAIGYYGLVRMVVDSWRIDPEWLGFNIGQVTGLIFLIISMVAIFYLTMYDKIIKVKNVKKTPR